MILFFLRMSMAVPILSDLSWYPVHDTVMGGRSEGGVRLVDEGMAFEGYLSLENNGGFASIRSRGVPDSLMQARGVKIRVLGDGRRYLATIRLKEYNRMLYLRVPFQTTENKEEEITIPFASFQVFAYGRPTPQVPAVLSTNSEMDSIGFMLADKKQGKFSLRLLAAQTYGERPSPPSITESQQRSIENAIAIGVPLYNKGDIDGCANEYERVLSQIHQEENSAWIEELFDHAPSNANDRAWWFRHMLNLLLMPSP